VRGGQAPPRRRARGLHPAPASYGGALEEAHGCS
jgi:hypothetical protein